MSQLWPQSAEVMSLVDACILLRPLMCSSVSCVDITSMYFLNAQPREVTTQALPVMLDDALAQQTQPFIADADSATRAMAVHALLQLQPAKLPVHLSSQPASRHSAAVVPPPPELDYFVFLGQLYAPDTVSVLRLHEGKLSAAVTALASPVEVPIFRWELSDTAMQNDPRRTVLADSGRESPAGFAPVESALRRLRIVNSNNFRAHDMPVWDEADCVLDTRLEWRNAVAFFRVIGLADVLLPLSVVRAVAREVVLQAQAHWLALALVERGLPFPDALKTVREAQTLVSRPPLKPPRTAASPRPCRASSSAAWRLETRGSPCTTTRPPWPPRSTAP